MALDNNLDRDTTVKRQEAGEILSEFREMHIDSDPVRQEIYQDILTLFGGDISLSELENMSMVALEELVASRTNILNVEVARNRIDVFNDMIANIGMDEEEKLLHHIFMNRLNDFNIFYEFITIFLSGCIPSYAYNVLPAQGDYDCGVITYLINVPEKEHHGAVVKYFSENPKFNFQNYDYDIRYSEKDSAITIQFIRL